MCPGNAAKTEEDKYKAKLRFHTAEFELQYEYGGSAGRKKGNADERQIPSDELRKMPDKEKAHDPKTMSFFI